MKKSASPTRPKAAAFSDEYWIWRWVYVAKGSSVVLHRVAAPFQPKPGDESEPFTAPIMCGGVRLLQVPGFASRMRAPRCRKCCRACGIEQGVGNPYNCGKLS
jgi:hypothetical protein